MFKFTIACLATTAMATADFEAYKGGKWRKLSASEKHATIMEEILANTTTADVRYGDLEVLFSELEMNKTTCNRNDEIPDRPKTLHQQGTVASVVYEDLGGHDYTGLFKGADFGIARLSDSGFPIGGLDESNPSVALKFFVDNEESANLMFMIDFNNQEGMNFFPENKHFTTHPIPFDVEDTCSRETILRKIREGGGFPFATGTGHFSDIDQRGWLVEDEVFPYELQLRVNHNAAPVFVEGSDQMDYLKSITVTDEPLFSVWARAEPPEADEDPNEEHF